jgi:hypothetical protein
VTNSTTKSNKRMPEKCIEAPGSKSKRSRLEKKREKEKTSMTPTMNKHNSKLY